METNEPDNLSDIGSNNVLDDQDSRSAVNSLILDYYKKFGRKRDLEQYFSLSTAQSDLRDPSGLFWRRMKAQNESSESSEKPSESSTELCKISITCSVPERKDDSRKTKSDSESPPIITEEARPISRHSDEESERSEGNQSQKSAYITLDTSSNKPLSPTSSITSQRKLEWDSLADVGYANESDRKTTSSSLSTIERLALLQQYSNNGNKDYAVGPPTAQSTPLDIKDDAKMKNKTNKKSLVKKTREIHSKDVDIVEVTVPQTLTNMPGQSFSVNLTKHISFNVEKDGGVVVEDTGKDVKVTPEKISAGIEVVPEEKFDKEIQTSLTRSNASTTESPKQELLSRNKIQTVPTGPVLISLNTLKRRIKRRKTRTARKKSHKRNSVSEVHEKSCGQVSEAESFEYMPGHMYNQNKMEDNQQKSRNSAGNKSSLESSGVTTESSKTTSFTRDLEKSIKLLSAVLRRHNDDSHLKNRMVKDVVQKLLKSKYKDDESTTDFSSKGLNKGAADRRHSATTSTSDANNYSNEKISLPKKSILRIDKFNSNAIASTSQSAPNLSSVSTSEKPVSILLKPVISSNTESDLGRDFSDIPFIKTSSEELYQKYLDAAKREDRYKRHLREKEMFLKQKLVGSDNNLQIKPQSASKLNKLKDLMNDLTRNNYNDGSGDASKLEGSSNGTNNKFEKFAGVRKQRSNSVFTLSSGNSNRKCPGSDDRENRKNDLRKRLQEEIDAGCSSKPGTSYNNSCRCPQAKGCHVTDGPVQVDTKKRSCKDSCSPRTNKEKDDKLKDIGASHIIVDRTTGQIVHYSGHDILLSMPENLIVYKCMDTKHNNAQPVTIPSNEICAQCTKIKKGSKPTSPCRVVRQPTKPEDLVDILQNQNFKDNASDKCSSIKKSSQSSQTDIALAMLRQKASESLYSLTSKGFGSSPKCNCDSSTCDCGIKENGKGKKGEECVLLHEITRITQTDISINPRIPDPTLSDISIVSEAECCIVVSERYREVFIESKSNVNRKNSETQMCAANDVFVSMTPRGSQGNVALKTFNFAEENKDWGKIANCEKDNVNSGDNAVFLQGISANTNSYTVPIEGTNMTLKVSIGTKQRTATIEPKQIEPDSQVFCTKGVENREQCINLQQNSLKTVQYQTNDNNVKGKCPCHQSVDAEMNTSPRDANKCITCRQIIIETDIGKRSPKVSKETNTVKTCKTSQTSAEKSSQYNTYPNSAKKTFIRTNTDTAIYNDEIPDKVRHILENKPLKSKDFDSCGFVPTSELKENICTEVVKTKVNETTKKYGSEKSTQLNPCTKKSNVSEVKITSVETRTDSDKSSRLNQCECKPTDFVDAFRPKSGSDLESTQCRDKFIDKKGNISAEEKSHSKTYESEGSKDLVMEAIKEITKRYSKKDTEKNERRKCFKEIMSVLNYLLDTEEATDADFKTSDVDSSSRKSGIEQSCFKKTIDSIEKPAKLSPRKSNKTVDATDNGRTGVCKCGSTKPKTKSISSENSEDKGCGSRSTNLKEEALITKKVPKTSCAGTSFSPKRFIDKAVQLSRKKSSKKRTLTTESSVSPRSSDPHDIPTDTATCKILKKIKNECDKYHKSRCKCHHTDNKIESSSTTTINCDACKKVHRCRCKTASKCRCHRHHSECSTKKSVAYNLIIQTSDSMISEEAAWSKTKQQLQNIVVKVPPGRLPEPQFRQVNSMPCRQPSPPGTNRGGTTQYYRCTRSRSLPHESDISSTDDFKRATQGLTVREYLEKNRPDFVEKASQRQNIMRMIGEARATERDVQRELLSMQVERESVLNRISASDLRQLAKELGIESRRKKPAAKFISEREMKKHSENIYKSLPEVIRKKEETKKENIKKSNLLMANIFKKSLQRKTLRGSVNLSNYNTVIKI